MTSTLYITVGNIGSGKSTYCRNLAEQGVIVVNHDSIVDMVHGGVYTNFDAKLAAAGYYMGIEAKAIHSALDLGRDVVVDRTCMSKADRKRLIEKFAQPHDAESVVVVFPMESPEIHANRRYIHDPRGMSYTEWLAVAEKMAAKFQPPDLSEGMTRIIRVGEFISA